jgi:hypothetical protein
MADGIATDDDVEALWVAARDETDAAVDAAAAPLEPVETLSTMSPRPPRHRHEPEPSGAHRPRPPTETTADGPRPPTTTTRCGRESTHRRVARR